MLFYVALDLVGVVDPLHQKGTLAPVFLDPIRLISRMAYHFFRIQYRGHVFLLMETQGSPRSCKFILSILLLSQLLGLSPIILLFLGLTR